MLNAERLLNIENFKYPSPTELGYPAGRNVSNSAMYVLFLITYNEMRSELEMTVTLLVSLSISIVLGDMSFSFGNV